MLNSAAMSQMEKILYTYCLIISFGFGRSEDAIMSPTAEVGTKSNCSCGGFSTPEPATNSDPLLSQAPGLVVRCDEEGESTCKSLCLALATATKAKGPEILCNRLKNADELKLSAFYKLCDKPWIYADMTADEPLCCEDSKVKTCASADPIHSTASQVEMKAV